LQLLIGGRHALLEDTRAEMMPALTMAAADEDS
jgi:hypothetical protein